MAKKKAGDAAPEQPAPELPTRDDVLALPHWPRVAYCARLARRVLPLVAACRETKVTARLRVPARPGAYHGAIRN